MMLVNPFITYGYESAAYFCDRKAETNELITMVTNEFQAIKDYPEQNVEELMRTVSATCSLLSAARARPSRSRGRLLSNDIISLLPVVYRSLPRLSWKSSC